jgi:membrane-associated phospholipid phosphatase
MTMTVFRLNRLILKILKTDARLTERLVIDPERRPLWLAAAIVAHSGDSWILVAGLGLVWLFGDASWHRFTAILLIAVVLQALLVFALKAVIKRQRPAGDWGAFSRQYDPHSFPSGHAVRAFMLMVLAIALGPAWVGWLLVLWAPLVSFSRVLTGMHYLSDVLAGMLIGLGLGIFTLAVYPIWMDLFPYLFY